VTQVRFVPLVLSSSVFPLLHQSREEHFRLITKPQQNCDKGKIKLFVYKTAIALTDNDFC